MLEKSNKEYVEWIKKPSSWGGSIEIMLASELYKCEIAAIDIKNERQEIFGQNNNYKDRIYLLYTGIHYDLGITNICMDGP